MEIALILAGLLAAWWVWSKFRSPKALHSPSSAKPAAGSEVTTGLAIAAEVLYRFAGPGSHEWIDVNVHTLRGERGRKDWILIREVAARGVKTGKRYRLTVREMLGVKDPLTNIEYRGDEDIARFFRLAAGGINQRDFDELPAWSAQRSAIVRARKWRDEHGAAGTRRPKRAIDVILRCRTVTKEAAEFAVAITALHTWGGVVWAFSGDAQPVEGSPAGPKEIYFTLPNGIDPENEVVWLRPADSEEHIADPAEWLAKRSKR